MNPITLRKGILPRPKALERWGGKRELSPRISRRSGRLARPLAAAGILGALALGAAATVIVVGGLLVMGIGLLAVGALALGGFWLKARRSGVWLHVLVDSDDVVISLAFPLPLSLIRWGLQFTPASNDASAIVRSIMEDPELLDALRQDAIEIIVDDDADHIELVIGSRRKRWSAFQFHPIRTISKIQSSPIPEEIRYV